MLAAMTNYTALPFMTFSLLCFDLLAKLSCSCPASRWASDSHATCGRRCELCQMNRIAEMYSAGCKLTRSSSRPGLATTSNKQAVRYPREGGAISAAFANVHIPASRMQRAVPRPGPSLTEVSV